MATRAFGTERTVDRLQDPVPILEATERGSIDEPAGEPPADTRPLGEGVINPGEIHAAEPARAKTGRPKGSKGKAKNRKRPRPGPDEAAGSASAKRAATQATLDLNNILFSIHLMGAALLKMPDLALTEEEAKHLATAITRVSELYELPLLDEKTRAWMNLGIVGFEVYGTRIVAHMAERKKKQPAPPPMVITPFRPPQHHPPPTPPPIDANFAEADAVMNGQA